MKALILTASLGGGHNAVARTLADQLESLGVEYRVIDIHGVKHPVYKKLVFRSYVTSMNLFSLTPKLSSKVYNGMQKSKIRAKKSSPQNNSYATASHLRDIIADYRPDFVLCTQVNAAQAVSILKKKGVLTCPCVGVVTDYNVQSYWRDTAHLDFITIPDENLCSELTRLGIDRDRILPIGIPVHQKFLNTMDRRAALDLLGLDPDLPTFLVMGGSMGFGIKAHIKSLLDLPFKFQTIIVCGRNERLYEQLYSMNLGLRFKLFGFSDNVNLLMDAADYVITKPGGLSISETLCKKKPILFVNPIPGMEEHNAAFITGEGAGLFVTKAFTLTDAVTDLLEHEGLRKSLQENAARLSKPNAAEELCRFIMDRTEEEA